MLTINSSSIGVCYRDQLEITRVKLRWLAKQAMNLRTLKLQQIVRAIFRGWYFHIRVSAIATISPGTTCMISISDSSKSLSSKVAQEVSIRISLSILRILARQPPKAAASKITRSWVPSDWRLWNLNTNYCKNMRQLASFSCQATLFHTTPARSLPIGKESIS